MPSCPIKMSRFLKFSRGSEFQFTRLDMAAPWGQYWRYLCKQNMHRYIYTLKRYIVLFGVLPKMKEPFSHHWSQKGSFKVMKRILRALSEYLWIVEKAQIMASVRLYFPKVEIPIESPF